MTHFILPHNNRGRQGSLLPLQAATAALRARYVDSIGLPKLGPAPVEPQLAQPADHFLCRCRRRHNAPKQRSEPPQVPASSKEAAAGATVCAAPAAAAAACWSLMSQGGAADASSAPATGRPPHHSGPPACHSSEPNPFNPRSTHSSEQVDEEDLLRLEPGVLKSLAQLHPRVACGRD